MADQTDPNTHPGRIRAWRLTRQGGELTFKATATPDVRPGTVLLRMEAVPLLSYMRDYISGKLPYQVPDQPFTPGTNGIGTIEAIGKDVYHYAVGQRVAVNPYLAANETVDEPAQVLFGLTGISPDCGTMLADWPDGTLSERVLAPASTLIPLEGLDALPSERLACLGKFAVPLGGLRRGRLTAGETLVVSGATGYFGSAAVLLGVALGAERVIAVGRSREGLDRLRAAAGPRVVAVELSGDIEADTRQIRKAAGSRGPHVAFDQVGKAADSRSTQSALKSLRRNGRLVLMGSLTSPLPINYAEVLINNLEIIGNFMYQPEDLRTLISLVRSGLLDLNQVDIQSHDITELKKAVDEASQMRGLDCTVVTMAKSEQS